MGLRQGLAGRNRSVPLARPQCRRLAMRQSIAKCTAASPQWPLKLANAIQQQPVVLLVCQAAVACQRMVSAVRDGFSRAFPQLQNVSKEVRCCRCDWGRCAACSAHRPPNAMLLCGRGACGFIVPHAYCPGLHSLRGATPHGSRPGGDRASADCQAADRCRFAIVPRLGAGPPRPAPDTAREGPGWR